MKNWKMILKHKPQAVFKFIKEKEIEKVKRDYKMTQFLDEAFKRYQEAGGEESFREFTLNNRIYLKELYHKILDKRIAHHFETIKYNKLSRIQKLWYKIKNIFK